MWASVLGPTDLAVWSREIRSHLLDKICFMAKQNFDAGTSTILQSEGMLTLVTLAEIRPRFQRKWGQIVPAKHMLRLRLHRSACRFLSLQSLLLGRMMKTGLGFGLGSFLLALLIS